MLIGNDILCPVYLFVAESLCSALRQTYADPGRHAVSSTSVVRETDEACYIIFPSDNPRAEKNWYQSRSNCLRRGGDLATDISPIINNAKGLFNLPNGKGYWIGLQQQQLVWFDKSGILLSSAFYLKVIVHRSPPSDYSISSISIIGPSLVTTIGYLW